MTQDLLILLLPYLSSDDASSLFELCLTPDVLGCKDNGVQKRGYKILAKIVERGNTAVDAEIVLRRLDSLGDELLPAAKKVASFTIIESPPYSRFSRIDSIYYACLFPSFVLLHCI
jgi:hypothetical protein